MYETGEQEETRMLPPAGLLGELEHAEGSRTARGQTEGKKEPWLVLCWIDSSFFGKHTTKIRNKWNNV
jgi:hypothetical protein